MAKNNFETPEVRTFPVIPKLENSATAHLSPFKSKEEFQTSLGYPGELVAVSYTHLTLPTIYSV